MTVWMKTATLLLGLQCITMSFGLPHQFPPNADLEAPADYFDATGDENIDMDKYVSGLSANIENQQEEKLLRMGNYLAEMLLMPWDGKGLPLLYVEEEEPSSSSSIENVLNSGEDFRELSPRKRSRFYRKYPYKRQNARQNYDAENRYLCQPSREDVYRLLVALHDSRQGGQGRNINFCNRKRPAKAIFTNIRFMG
ncbi:uncharacterized protein [Atheta coriaria]|uniref:uncharacterized protein n=1 Tax=Dalotia coriaria TaxID=877792 RepID=UPI0031F3E834